MKRFFIIAATFLLSVGCSRELVILHVNDTHSHFEPLRMGEQKGMGGVIERAAFVDSVRKAHGRNNVLLLHAGDFSQGSSYFTIFGGDLEVDVINAMDYDCITLGNHEFDNGIEDLGRRMAAVNCPVVCANYDFSPFELGEYVKPYAIVRKAGRKIGIFGLLTDVSTVVDRTIADRMPKFDDIEAANKWAAYLKNEAKCDLVIALTHVGYGGLPETPGLPPMPLDTLNMSDRLLVSRTRNIDLIIGGHSHTFLEKMEYEDNLDGIPTPIVQDGCWGLYHGKITVK